MSIVVPVLNEESIIEELNFRIQNIFKDLDYEFELIFVDDGSSDQTWKKIETVAMSSKETKGIKLSRNFGHHAAISAGLQNTKGDWIVVMDGDLQDRPEEIPRLLSKANEGFDVVFVSRVERPESRLYLIVQKLFYKILRNLSGLNLDSKQANFSVISRNVANAFLEFSEKSRFYPAIIMWLGFNRAEIFAKHGERFDGKPSYSLKKRIVLALDIIAFYSIRPLYLTLGFGAIINFIFLLINIFISEFLTSKFMEENSFSLIKFTFFFNIILFFLIFGIYVFYFNKLIIETRNRPLYVIATKI